MKSKWKILLICSYPSLEYYLKEICEKCNIDATFETYVPESPEHLLDVLPDKSKLTVFNFAFVDPELFPIEVLHNSDLYESLSGGQKVLFYLRRHNPKLPVIAITRWFSAGVEEAMAVANIPFDAYVGTSYFKSPKLNLYWWEKLLLKASNSRKSTFPNVIPVSYDKLRDVFICHASEDKKRVVNPLLRSLRAAALSYWYDEEEISWGDSIVDKINIGLKNSRYVIVILSKNSVNKNWPKRELFSALQSEISAGGKRILPIIVGDKETSASILSDLPLLSDRRYLRWENDPNKVVYELYNILGKAGHQLG